MPVVEGSQAYAVAEQPRMDPREEHAQLLVHCLEAAQKEIDRARKTIEEFEPIARSCKQGLDALNDHRDPQPDHKY